VRAERYELVVRGTLSPAVASAIEGFDVVLSEGGRAHLVGWVGDQAGLHHVFEILRDLNISLVSLNRVDIDELVPH
jgi:hypothetical protein